MFCEKCGSVLENNKKACGNCGYVLDKNTNIIADSNEPILEKVKKRMDIIYFVIAGIVLIMFFIAASDVSKAGKSISEISSVGGQTLDEAYFYNLRGIYSGISVALSATGITLSSILVWLGVRKNEEMSKV